ncbi:MAG: HAD family hydrolase [Actinomycetota bacterium]
MNEVRAVLLDLYDTLAWTEWKTMRVELEERLGLERKDLLRAFDRSRPKRSTGAFGSAEGDLAAILEAAGVPPEPELVRELTARTTTFLETGVSLWEDSVPVMRELRRRGLPLAIVSNCDHSTRAVVERLGLYDEADAVILSFEVGAAKPSPEIYRAALERLDVEAEDALFVDDQAGYCDGAAALGIQAVLIVREGVTPAEGVSEPGGNRVIADLRALLELV